jgi:hypothetical protein
MLAGFHSKVRSLRRSCTIAGFVGSKFFIGR